jgi:hypothetical protein
MRKKTAISISLTLALLGTLIFALPAGADHGELHFLDINDYADYFRSNPSALPRSGTHKGAPSTANMQALVPQQVKDVG